MDGVQFTVARSLDIDCNKVDVTVRRLGGGYGGKIYLPSGVAGACAIAANKVNRPVRLVLDIQTNMEGFGKRVPYLFNYTVMHQHFPIGLLYSTLWKITEFALLG